jgi:asparagine synthase (glutamine-hydrolysing)
VCGIVGRVNFRSKAPIDQAVIEKMCELVRHRGPDGSGVFVKGAVGLGHRRLAVIDLSDAGRQPMSNASGHLWITYNGEVYNFKELRRTLEGLGYRFRSATDTEVILAAYEAWGPDCVERLRGMFALAIWDDTKHTLWLARDRLGEKPLYYRLDDEGVSFASEPKAFLGEPGFSPRPNPVAISHYLSLQYVPCPLSAFEGVARLPPDRRGRDRDSAVLAAPLSAQAHSERGGRLQRAHRAAPRSRQASTGQRCAGRAVPERRS